jgi:FixJ family two-component response regulator
MQATKDRSFLISVVDDDISVRESLKNLLQSIGFRVEAFSGAEEFLASNCISSTRCLILDIRMGGMSGLELQQHLKEHHYSIPIVFISAKVSKAVRENVLAEGAVDCLIKPLTEADLLSAVNKALNSS